MPPESSDRDELDIQIEQVFARVNEKITRIRRGSELVQKINDSSPVMMCSLIQKCGKKKKNQSEETDYAGYIQEIQKSLPENFSPKGDFYVFVDECHRTQSGKLHQAMKLILPDATFIGFTGTPLMKADKEKSIEVFGPYIHRYKYDEAVRDKVVLDLMYEAREVEQNVVGQDKIDAWFEAKTRGLSDVAKAKLKQRWGTLQKICFEEQSRQTKRQYITGESYYLWGRRYRLDVQYSNIRNQVYIAGGKLILQVRKESTDMQRENVLNEWYRDQMKQVVPDVLRKCENIVGVQAEVWYIKNMRTKWGTCNIEKKRIWLNLQLVKKTPECLEYVIIHELVHFLERNHNEKFCEYMNCFCPNWREIRDSLNQQMLDYFEEKNQNLVL